MKRSPLPPRKAPLKRSTKPIRKLNPERAARRQKAYALYLRSPEWKEKKRLVRERSGGRCERQILICRYPAVTPLGLRALDEFARCTRKAAVCNHKTYARFGHENLEDLEDLCDPHNEQFEAQFPYRASRRLALARGEKANG